MKIPTDIKATVTAGLPLVISIFLFFVVGNFGISKITDIRTQVSQAQSDQNVLKEKVNLLQSESAIVSDSSSAAATALPDSNTVLAMISQLKNLATTNGLILNNLKAGSPNQDTSGLSRIDVSFEAVGSRDQVAAYLNGIAGVAPIMIVTNIKLSESGGTQTAALAVRSFWAALPKTLPTSTQPITDLTADEKATLDKVSALTPPSFSVLPAAETSGKVNPFQ